MKKFQIMSWILLAGIFLVGAAMIIALFQGNMGAFFASGSVLILLIVSAIALLHLVKKNKEEKTTIKDESSKKN